MGSNDLNAFETPEIFGYTDFESIAVGGFCTVYKAHHIGLGRDVAVKVFDRHLSDVLARSFAREREAAKALSGDPHVVALWDGGVTNAGKPYLIFEFLGEGSLADLLERSGPLGVDDALRYTVAVASALETAHHHGVYHRDVKPANILLRPNHEAALADFGIARLLDPLDTGTVQAMTPPYAPPEAFTRPVSAGDDHEFAAWDIYSLGATLYELLSGSPPFPVHADEGWAQFLARVATEEPPRITRPDVSDELRAVVGRALAKQPSDRYASVADMRGALLAVPPTKPATTVGGSTMQPKLGDAHASPPGTGRAASGKRNRMAVIGATAAAIVVVAVVFATCGGSKKTPRPIAVGDPSGGTTTPRATTSPTGSPGSTPLGPVVPGGAADLPKSAPAFFTAMANTVSRFAAGDHQSTLLTAPDGATWAPGQSAWASVTSPTGAPDEITVTDAVTGWSHEFSFVKNDRINTSSLQWSGDARYLFFNSSDTKDAYVIGVGDTGPSPSRLVDLNYDFSQRRNERVFGAGTNEELWLCDNDNNVVRVTLKPPVVKPLSQASGNCHIWGDGDTAPDLRFTPSWTNRPVVFNFGSPATVEVVRAPGRNPVPVTEPTKGWPYLQESCTYGTGTQWVNVGDNWAISSVTAAPKPVSMSPKCPSESRDDLRFADVEGDSLKTVVVGTISTNNINPPSAPIGGMTPVQTIENVQFTDAGNWVIFHEIQEDKGDVVAYRADNSGQAVDFSALGLTDAQADKICLVPGTDTVVVPYTSTGGDQSSDIQYDAVVDLSKDATDAVVAQNVTLDLENNKCSASADGKWLAAGTQILDLETYKQYEVGPGNVRWTDS